MDGLREFSREGWTWHLKDASVLDPWFEDFLAGRAGPPFKSNAVRQVFRVVSSGRVLFVKYDRPRKTFARLKSRMLPKARQEYESALLLERCGIPSPECVGWGRRGPESIVISHEVPNSANAREFWFKDVLANESTLRQPYLVELGRFLEQFFYSGLYHPDFHLGNLVLGGSPLKFHLVDPYGVRNPDRIDGSQIFQMARIVGALRGELTTGEAAAMILYANVNLDPETALIVWKRILKEETAEAERLWRKRKGQILAHDSRYCVETPGRTLLVRCGIHGEPLEYPLDAEESVVADGKYERLKCKSPTEGERLWLLSYKLQLHRLNHRMPVIAELDKSGRCSALFFERPQQAPEKDLNRAELLHRCELAGIDAESVESNFDVSRGKLRIADISRLNLEV